MTSFTPTPAVGANSATHADSLNSGSATSSEMKSAAADLAAKVLLAPPPSIPASNYWKSLLLTLIKVAPLPEVPCEALDLNPKTRFQTLSKTALSNEDKQRIISLIAMERKFLAIGATEAKLGMKVADSVERLKGCGIQAKNDGKRWVYESHIQSPETSEGFAFLWPLLTHLAMRTSSSAFEAQGLTLNFNWEQDLKPMKQFLEESVNHSHPEVSRLAKGYLTMLTVNQEIRQHAVFYDSDHLPFILKLLRKSGLVGDQKMISLLPHSAPVLFRLLILEVRDILTAQSPEHSQGNHFLKGIYESKSAWHEFAKGNYLTAQNKFYQYVWNRFPNDNAIFLRSSIYLSERLPEPEDLAKQDPYSSDRIVHVGHSLESPVLEPVNTQKVSSTSSETIPVQTSAQSATVPTASWLQNAQPFHYHGCVIKWFKIPSNSDTKLEQQRAFHAFHPWVDKLVLEKLYAYHKEERRKHSYHLVAQFDLANGTSHRGIVSYGTYRTNAGIQTCYHRHFSEKNDDEFLLGKLQQVFANAEQDAELMQVNLEQLFPNGDFDEGEGQEVNPAQEAGRELPRIEVDSLLGIIKIHDVEKGLVISIFRLP